MISRHWRGLAKTDEAENYIRHLHNETFPKLATIAGFRDASILRRVTTRGIEFLIVTTWQSEEAIREFAGESMLVAVVPGVVQAMMIEYDREVAQYEIVEDSA
jgi:heme-degrading monooxygenase HmoA